MTQQLLAPHAGGADYQTVQDYRRWLSSSFPVEDNLAGERRHTAVSTPFGKALSPMEAERCLLDFVRTKTFIRGLYAAIQKALTIFPERPVRVLYAGTGPFAALAIPMTTLFTPETVQFTFLEIHPASFRRLQKVWEHPALHPYVKDMVQTDALRYHPEAPVHLLLTETMNQALEKETQVAITRHLTAYLAPEGLLVPESIQISAGVIKEQFTPEGKFTREMMELSPVFTLSKNAFQQFKNGFPTVSFPVPPSISDRYRQLYLFTRIQVYEDDWIPSNASGITIPLLVSTLTSSPQTCHFQFTYQISENPGFQWTTNLYGNNIMASPNPTLRLPFTFDVAQLQLELQTCEQWQWKNHHNTQDYSGEWIGIALRSDSGAEQDIMIKNGETCQDTELMTHCPYIKSVVQSFRCTITSVRLLALLPGSTIKTHRDRGLNYENGCFRLHIPIVTDPEVDFIVNGERLQMHPGECWYANFDLPHSVTHRGSRRRVHLVIDGVSNEWTDQLFQEAGFSFEYRDAPALSEHEKRTMIELLEKIGTPAALDIIAKMK